MMADTFLPGWLYRKKVTIQHANVDSNLADFPLYVPIVADANMATALAAGADVRLTQGDGTTLLKYEIEAWAGGGGAGAVTADIWAKTPSILAAGGSYNYVYWGKAGASDGQDAANVWAPKGVWHLSDAAGALTDSSGGGHDTTAEAISAYGQAGKVADAVELDGANDFGTVDDHADFDFAGAFSLEAWANPDNTDDLGYLLYRYDAGSGDGYAIYQITDGAGVWGFFVYVGGVNIFCLSDGAPSGGWQHIVGTRDGAGNCTLYVDGVAQADTETLAGAIDSNGSLHIGQNFIGTGRYDGLLDEARVWATDLSADWIKFTHANINEGDNELTWGPMEQAPTMALQMGTDF